MPTPVTVADVRAKARRSFDRNARDWALGDARAATLEVPLHPPTERGALADLDRARGWVEEWRDADAAIAVTWAARTWSRVGSQRVPERACIVGGDAIARVAGAEPQWRILTARVAELRALLGEGDLLFVDDASLRPHLPAVADLSDDDAARLLGVVRWLRGHPDSNRFVRELPIRGIDSKWIETHRGLVQGVLRAATGRDSLGLRDLPRSIRLRLLDSTLVPGGLTDISAPVVDVAAMQIQPATVLVVENLQTMLAMPHARGTVVLHGGGYRVPLIAALPWAQSVTYWGDLDSHGFAIVHRLRLHGVDVRTALMDTETLVAHRDLWGVDPKPSLAHLGTLTDDEQATLLRLSAEGNVRLEQERVSWDYALERLGLDC